MGGIIHNLMSEIFIRQANRDDAQAISELQIRSIEELCKSYYTEKQIRDWINIINPEVCYPPIDRNIFFVAIKDSKIVGFGGAVPGEVEAVYVSPDSINSGIGSMLLQYALKTARKSSRVTVISTLNAAGFYAGNGFVEIERIISTRGNIELPCVYMELKASE